MLLISFLNIPWKAFNCSEIGLEITRNNSIANAEPDLVQKKKNKLVAASVKIKASEKALGRLGSGYLILKKHIGF
jgi:hypothetical protein